MIPFGEWMRMAGGWMGWSEQQFWASSPQWFRAAWKGHLHARGIKTGENEQALRDDWEAFKAEHAGFLGRTSADLKRMRELRESAITPALHAGTGSI